MKAVRRHTDCKWVLLYIERWLTVPYELKDGNRVVRNQDVAQGSVIGSMFAAGETLLVVASEMKRSADVVTNDL